jgi:hypothetical protein
MVLNYNSLSNAPNSPQLPQPFSINWLWKPKNLKVSNNYMKNSSHIYLKIKVNNIIIHILHLFLYGFCWPLFETIWKAAFLKHLQNNVYRL